MCQLGQPPLLDPSPLLTLGRAISCRSAFHATPSSAVLPAPHNEHCSHIRGTSPILLPNTLGNGSSHHCSKIHPGRKHGPDVCFPKSSRIGRCQLHSMSPTPASWGGSSSGQSSPGLAHKVCQSTPALWWQTLCNL